MSIRMSGSSFMVDTLLPEGYAEWFGIPRRIRVKGFDTELEARAYEAAIKVAVDSKQPIPDKGEKAMPKLHEALDLVVERFYKGGRSEVLRGHQAKALKGYFPNIPLDQLSSLRIDQTVDRMKETYKPNTINGCLAVLSRTVKTYERYGVIKAPLIGRVRAKNKAILTLNGDEEARLLETLRGSSGYPLIVLYIDTGARRSEILNLKPRDVDLERGVVAVDGKTGPRSIPLTPRAKEVLREAVLGRPPDLRIWGMSKTTLSRQFSEGLKKAGVVRHLTIHDLRHTFCTRLSERGVNPFIIQKLAGHTNISTTQRYTHVNVDALHQGISVLG